MGICLAIAHLLRNNNLCLLDRFRYHCCCAGHPYCHNNCSSVTYLLPSIQEEVKYLPY